MRYGVRGKDARVRMRSMENARMRVALYHDSAAVGFWFCCQATYFSILFFLISCQYSYIISFADLSGREKDSRPLFEIVLETLDRTEADSAQFGGLAKVRERNPCNKLARRKWEIPQGDT